MSGEFASGIDCRIEEVASGSRAHCSSVMQRAPKEVTARPSFTFVCIVLCSCRVMPSKVVAVLRV